MKIALVVGHFVPSVGYQEVYLARAFSRLGHDVCVFTSAISAQRDPANKAPDPNTNVAPAPADATVGFRVVRLATVLRAGSVVMGKGLRRAVMAYAPDLTILIGVGQLFPWPLLVNGPPQPMVALFGDNSDYFNWDTVRLTLVSIRVMVVKKLLKKWIYRQAVKTCRTIYLNTPETGSILLKYLTRRSGVHARKKFVPATLGFDPAFFYFDAEERHRMRTHLGITDQDIVFMTSTRVMEKKNIETIVEYVTALNGAGFRAKYIIVGFLGDRYEAKLKDVIRSQPDPGLFLCYPFIGHEKIRKLCAAADAGIWLKASISIQEAMGTGLPILLEKKASVGHLLTDNVNGWYYRTGHLYRAMTLAARNLAGIPVPEKTRLRRHIADTNERTYSYDHIAGKILADLEQN